MFLVLTAWCILHLQALPPLTFERLTVLPGAQANLKLGPKDIPVVYQQPAEGFLRLSGYKWGDLFGQYILLGSLIAYWKVGELMPGLGESLNAGFSLETGLVEQSSDALRFDNLIYAGSLFVGADTLLGPLYLAIGQAEEGNTSLYIYLGQSFL